METILAIGVIVSLGINVFQLFRVANGTDSQRQIEPTAIASIQAELKNQTQTLGKLDREMGGVTSSVENITREIAKIQVDHRIDIRGLHQRIDGISEELAGTSARVQGLEKRELNNA